MLVYQTLARPPANPLALACLAHASAHAQAREFALELGGALGLGLELSYALAHALAHALTHALLTRLSVRSTNGIRFRASSRVPARACRSNLVTLQPELGPSCDKNDTRAVPFFARRAYGSARSVGISWLLDETTRQMLDVRSEYSTHRTDDRFSLQHNSSCRSARQGS